MFPPPLQTVFATEAPGIVGQGQTRRKVLTQFSVASGKLYIQPYQQRDQDFHIFPDCIFAAFTAFIINQGLVSLGR